MSAKVIMSATRGRVVERLVEVEEDLRAVALDRRVVAREAARRRVVRHVARDLAVRLEHADEGEDLQLADHRDVVPLLLRRHIRDVAAVREERVLALDDAKALHAVAEERGHRDAAVLDLGVAKVADGLVVVERPERHARAAERVPEARVQALRRALREVDQLIARRRGRD